MHPRKIRELMERAGEAVTGSLIACTDSIRGRAAWRTWRAQWADLERLPAAEQLLAVCMYCERFRATTGEWVACPPGLVEMIHDPHPTELDPHHPHTKCRPRAQLADLAS
jgi:hypothetical protein